MGPSILFIGVVAWLLVTAVRALSAQPNLSVMWTASGAGVRSVSFASNGKYVVIVSSGGKIDCRSTSGTKLWSSVVKGANAAVIAPDASCALAYSRLNPVNKTVTFLDANGKVYWKKEVEGAVWCADACLASGGARFVIGTGERHVYVVDTKKNHRRYRRWNAPGAVVSMCIDSRGETVTFGTWQESTVGRATIRGRRIWEIEYDSANLQRLACLATGKRLFVRSIPNNTVLDGEFAALASGGDTIWSGRIDVSRRTRVLVSPDGRYVCEGYTKIISHKGETEREEHAILHDSTGRQIWDKGSLFFRAYPILVTSSGLVLVEGAKNELFWIGRSGEPDPSIKMKASILACTVSRDGSRAALQCSDGKLYILAITQ